MRLPGTPGEGRRRPRRCGRLGSRTTSLAAILLPHGAVCSVPAKGGREAPGPGTPERFRGAPRPPCLRAPCAPGAPEARVRARSRLHRLAGRGPRAADPPAARPRLGLCRQRGHGPPRRARVGRERAASRQFRFPVPDRREPSSSFWAQVSMAATEEEPRTAEKPAAAFRCLSPRARARIRRLHAVCV